MPQYKSLRTLAFQFAGGVKTIPRTGVTLAFPEAWKDLLNELNKANGPARDETKYLPTRSLNGGMRTLVADLVGIQRYLEKPGEHPWLVSERPIAPTALLPIIHAWVRTAFDRAPRPLRDATLAQLTADVLRWQPAAPEMKVTVGDNGTAHLGDAAFQLLPDLLAARLSQPGDGLTYGETTLTFRRVLRPAGASGAELMSWPPLEYKRGHEVGWFSITIMITAQTIPFCADPQIYCNLGIRRWVSRPDTSLRGGKTTLYLHTSVPWIEGLTLTPTFGAARVQWTTSPQGEREAGDNPWRLIWSDGLGPLLADLHLTGHFPDPNAILADPGAALNREGQARVTAGLVYSTDMKPLHTVRPGLMPADRRLLAEQIAARFAPLLTFTEPAPRVRYSMGTKLAPNPFFAKGKDEQATHQAARRNAVAAATGDPACLEVWYQSGTMRDAVVETLAEEFGLNTTSAEEQTWTLPEGTITLRAHPLGRHGDALNLPKGRKHSKDQIRAATQARATDIGATLPPLPEETIAGALVELVGKGEFNGDDPKGAIRAGFAATNRLTQFLTPIGAEDDPFAHRVREGLRDLLRQFGVQPVPLVVQPKPQPGQGVAPVQHYVGAWMVKEGKNYAVLLVDLPAGSTTVRVHLPGHPGWITYPAAHLALARGEVAWRRWPDEGQTDLGMLQELAEVLAPLGDTLLLVEASNLRRVWPWLQNGNLTTGGTNFGTAQVQRLLPYVRLVRLRGGNETPQWYGQDGSETGFAQGLFQLGRTVFASTHPKSGKFKKIRVVLSKAPHPDNKGNAGKQAWNPGLYELTVICPAGEDPGQWAARTHHLRAMAPHNEEVTIRPLPLHLAKKLAEYAAGGEGTQDEGEAETEE